jgi:hypothetical protein
MVLAKTGKELLRAMNIPAPEIRGLGLTVRSLDDILLKPPSDCSMIQEHVWILKYCVTVQMTKLDNDPASSLARPSAPAPAKGAVPAPTHYDPNAQNPFAAFYDLPVVKAAMPPQKERLHASGAPAPASAAGHSPHGPLEGLLRRQSSYDGFADSSAAAQPETSFSEHRLDDSGDDRLGQYGSDDLDHVSHAPAAEVTSPQDSTRCLDLESLPSADCPGMSMALDKAGSISGALYPEDERAAKPDGGGDMWEAASVHELSERSIGPDEVDADVGSHSERGSAEEQAAGRNVSVSGGNVKGVLQVSLSQLDIAVWSELPHEVQEHLLQSASGKQRVPEALDSRKQVCHLS